MLDLYIFVEFLCLKTEGYILDIIAEISNVYTPFWIYLAGFVFIHSYFTTQGL